VKKVLYLGTDPSLYAKSTAHLEHHPVIKIEKRDFSSFQIQHQIRDFKNYTHIIFTSKNTVMVLKEALEFFGYGVSAISSKVILSIGDATSKALTQIGVNASLQPEIATQEGMMDLLDRIDCEEGYFFYPRSSRARATLSYYMRVRKLRHQVCDLYDTKLNQEFNIGCLDAFSEIVFTSPSTVNAFYRRYPSIPSSIKISAIGPITQAALDEEIGLQKGKIIQ
jgi:uroporphyrinogen-III synthase